MSINHNQNNEKAVLIYRKYMLPYSETFIADQGKFLHEYQANYVGLKTDPTGIGLIDGMPGAILDAYAKSLLLSKFLFRRGFLNKSWMSEILNFNATIIHSHFLNDGFDALKLKKSLKLPLVITLHGHDITKQEKSFFADKNRKMLFDRTDKVIAVSDYIYECALKRGCPESKLVKHSIGIDLEKFKQDKSEAESPELLFVGRLVEKKGCIYLLEALSRLQSRYPDLKLIIVGDGPLKKSLIGKVEEQGLNVEFVGKQSAAQIRERLSRCWMFVAPSITAEDGDAEGLGMVFLEAQALQTPVVSFRSGGVVEAISDGNTGLLSAEKNVEGLVEHIEYFINDTDARREFGKRGRLRVEQNFNIRKQCQLLEDIYDSVS